MKRRLTAILVSLLVVIAPVLINAAPAQAFTEKCRSPYYGDNDEWYAFPCVAAPVAAQDANGNWYLAVRGFSVAYTYPANCHRIATYLVNEAGQDIVSTSRHACSNLETPYVFGWNGLFNNRPAKARLRAWNSAGAVILNIQSPFVASS